MLAKLVSTSPADFAMSSIIDVVKSPSINEGLSELLVAFRDNWIDPIIAYLKKEKLLKDKLGERKLRLQATTYVIIGKTLYKRGLSIPFLRCVLPEEGIHFERCIKGYVVVIQQRVIGTKNREARVLLADLREKIY